MAKTLFGLPKTLGMLVLLVVIIVSVMLVKSFFPGLLEGFEATRIEPVGCDRSVTCPEGSFCENNRCISIEAPKTNQPPTTGYFS